MRLIPFSLFAFMLLLSSCGSSGGEKQTTDTEADAELVKVTALAVSPFTPSQAYPNATMTSMAFENGTFNFGVADYELGIQTPDAEAKMCANSAKGQHIHLIVDNMPYAAKYESSFDYKIGDGEHYILAFLSRSYHESIKNGTAYKAQKVTITNNTITSSEDIMDPMLFYSRPKGTYVGKEQTDKVMLDFYLVNANLGTDYKVKANINGEEKIMDVWQPYYLEGLPMGENTITLTLIDGADNTVDTPLNPVTRTFTLKEYMPKEQ